MFEAHLNERHARVDWQMIAAIFGLMVIGAAFIYSAKPPGETTAWHSDDHFFFKPEFIAELRALKPRTITRPERYFAVIAKGDELLDWREMSARYVACRMKLLDAGDHALSDFDMHLPDVLRFLGLESPLTSE